MCDDNSSQVSNTETQISRVYQPNKGRNKYEGTSYEQSQRCLMGHCGQISLSFEEIRELL